MLKYIKLFVILFIAFFLSCKQENLRNEKLIEFIKNFDQSKLNATIIANKTVYKLGEIPQIKCEIYNKSNRTINLISAQDGSSNSSRYPYCEFIIYHNDKIAKLNYLKCRSIDNLKVSDFHKILPNSTFNPISKSRYKFEYQIHNTLLYSKPGKYKIVLKYSTSQDTLLNWIGFSDLSETNNLYELENKCNVQEILKMFKLVPKINIVSDTLNFEII